MTYIDSLQHAIFNTHRCKAAYSHTVPVQESYNDQILWDGEVEVFTIEHPSGAPFCYAWGFLDNGTQRFTCVLAIPPLLTPKAAVQAALASELKLQLK